VAEDLKDNAEETHEEGEMTFLEHLEELRWRIIKALIGLVIGAILCWIFIDYIMNNFLLLPAQRTTPPLKLINLKPYGQFVLYVKVVIVCGFIVSIPNVFRQFWKFIEPGLLPKERRYIWRAVFFSTFCFLAGLAFCYFVILPIALGFFAAFGTQAIENTIDAGEYLKFILSLLIASGLVFELPVISYLLSAMGILTPKFMRKYRKHAIVVIVLIAGIITPSPDITSQVLMALPLLLLYEISIFISKMAQPKKIEEV